jgi:MFS transporter, DHA2 family, multidrug resistance protein
VPADAARATHDTPAGAAAGLSGRLGAELLASAREAFMGGMHVAASISALLLVAVAVTVATLLRHVRPAGGGESPEPPALEARVEAAAPVTCRSV